MKRYGLMLTNDLFGEVEEAAKAKEISMIDLLRGFIRMGLILHRADRDGAQIIVRQGGTEKQIVLTW